MVQALEGSLQTGERDQCQSLKPRFRTQVLEQFHESTPSAVYPDPR